MLDACGILQGCQVWGSIVMDDYARQGGENEGIRLFDGGDADA